MRMYDLIAKKKQKESLTDEEISFMIQGYVEGGVSDFFAQTHLLNLIKNG